MDGNVQFKQIILVTDGESNVGVNPVTVAKCANKKGIIISTIGIIEGKDKENPMAEVQNIADAGGGICEFTDINNFSKTMEMVTQASVYKTIEHAVNKELKDILGTEIKETHPESRKKITNIIDKLGEEVTLKCCIIIDCSGSMINKINIAKNSILNLLRVLRLRKGKTEIAVIGYPGREGENHTLLCDFTEDIINLERGFQNISVGGTTPTGYALECAMNLLLEKKCGVNSEHDRLLKFDEEAILSDNII